MSETEDFFSATTDGEVLHSEVDNVMWMCNLFYKGNFNYDSTKHVSSTDEAVLEERFAYLSSIISSPYHTIMFYRVH